MTVISKTVRELRERLEAARKQGRTIGLAPTMGALHAGHGSLVRAALRSCDVAVASIFVNPRQFGAGEDLDRYPRPLEADVAYLEELGCHHLFLPPVEEMYPEGSCTRVEMDGLTIGLCGRSRPTHFGGVLTVVLKLLNQVGPDVAYFGRKDYQQALVIRRMVVDLDVPVCIDVCPIVREADGLALSSRNRYLSTAERADALALRRAILAMDTAFREGTQGAEALLTLGRAILEAPDRVTLDYLELCHPETLVPREGAVAEGDLIAVAARLGATRLIDNGLLGQESPAEAP